jgi:large subunit ribosomal protein L28
MARECDVCGKRAKFGNHMTRRGLAKYKGGVGIKTTGVTRRQFRPNLQLLKTEEANGTVHRIKACTRCIKSGMIKKPLKRDIPEGLLARMRADVEAKTPEARKKAAAKRGEARRGRRAEMKKKIAAKAAGKAGKTPAKPAAPAANQPKKK